MKRFIVKKVRGKEVAWDSVQNRALTASSFNNPEHAKLNPAYIVKLLNEKYPTQLKKFRADVWIHAGGDDEEGTLTVFAPTLAKAKAKVERWLKDRGSLVTKDYRIREAR
jgi:hypothetical protein